LVQYFLKDLGAKYKLPVLPLSRPAQHVLFRHSSPGNVREFENVLNSACMSAKTGLLPSRAVLSSAGWRGEASFEENIFQCKELVSLAELEHRYAEIILRTFGYNKAKSAQALSISRPKLYRLLDK